MNDSPRNLFNALFDFRPREGNFPKENFLSEAFAYVLETNEDACDAWLSLALGRQVHALWAEVTTRNSERDEDNNSIFPDMVIEAELDGESRIHLYSEHKWDSPCNESQIKKYLKLVKQYGKSGQLVFIGAYRNQKQAAENCDPQMKGKSFLWADIYKVFERLPNKSGLFIQFLNFMETNSLNPGKPIKSSTMLAYIQSAGFLDSLNHCAMQMNDEYEWDFFPKRYRSDMGRKVTNRWGRIAIEFATPTWKPTITIGFLYDEKDHGVTFINRQRGIDLLLRLEADPKELKNIAPVIGEIRLRRKALSKAASSVLLLDEKGNDNGHTILIVRSCLGDVIESAATQEQQAELIHAKLKEWGEILFIDGALESAFKKAGLDGGM